MFGILLLSKEKHTDFSTHDVYTFSAMFCTSEAMDPFCVCGLRQPGFQ